MTAIFRIFLSILLLWVGGVYGQSGTLPLNREIHGAYEHLSVQPLINFHSSVKPYSLGEIQNLPGADSAPYPSVMDKWNHPVGAAEKGQYQLSFGALLLLQQGFDGADTAKTNLLGSGLGLFLKADLGKKFSVYGSFYADNSSYPAYLRNYISSVKVVPGGAFARGTNLGSSFTNYEVQTRWTPNKNFAFEAGRGKHFFGDGYRSMLLSDNAFNYPYLRLETSAWKIKYVNLFAMLRDFSSTPNQPELSNSKFMATHYLSWNATRRLNISLFESILWPGRDSLLNRGFEVNYLNPIIFYRPVEYSQGSSDNALMGLNASVKVPGRVKIYTQILFDEFLLKEIRADIKHTFSPTDTTFDYGWWANKFGVQFGVKAFDVFGVKDLHVQSEINLARPFTYSHGAVVQNYGHYNQPLAHPMGANFKESVNFVKYKKGNFHFEEQFNFATFGTDSSTISYGGNLFVSYNNRSGTYNHEIGQGVRNALFYNSLRVSYLIDFDSNLRIEIGHVYRRVENEFGVNSTNFIYLGLKTNIWNRYQDF